MGEVFRATDELLGRTVAVKLLLPNLSDPQAAERFQREARAAAMLNDPHLVAVYDFGPHDGGFFLVMELVEGGTVGGELERTGPLPKDRAIEIVEQSAAGLAVAHRHDVVHRDVKPGNLLLTPEGSVKIADFGIAHRTSDAGTALTATGQIIGSSHYLAPERARGEQGGQPSDIYALGCVLYQLVTGGPPFTAEHPTGILFQHVDTPPVPPSQSRPELAGPFETVLLQMLAKSPTDRPSAADIAAGALRTTPTAATGAATAAIAGTAIAAGAGAGGAGTTSALPVVGGAGSARVPPSRRKSVLIAAAAALATAVAVGVGLLLAGGEDKGPATNDVGPQPSATAPTQGPTTTESTEPTEGPTSRSTATRPTPTTTPSTTPTPTPTPTNTTSATPTPTPSSPAPTKSDTPPPSSTPEPSESNTPPPDPPSKTPPPSSRPSETPPAEQ